MAIKTNKIKCLHCGDIIKSKHTHDFKRCRCGKVYVDGGLSYMRRGFPEGNWQDHYEELSEEE